MNIIFDFDGTLIDSSERMYRLFQRLVPESTFLKEEYWSLKRNKMNHKMILERYFPDHDFNAFEDAWLRMIELREYLDMDQNYPDTFDVLMKLRTKGKIILLTARQSKEGLYSELERLGIRDFFNCILVTEAKQSKEELLIGSIGNVFDKTDDDLFVSDMGTDISLGNRMDYHTIAITHGFMCRECLSNYYPEYMVDNLMDINVNFLKK